MTRMIITLEEADKSWLAKESRSKRKSIAQIIREAIKSYQKTSAKDETSDFERALEQSRGTWTKGDPLEYQNKIRTEWNDRP